MNLCESLLVLKIISMLKSIISVLKIVIPLLLIIFIIIDTIKYITDPEGNKKVIEISIKRFISAIVIFLVPTIVSAVFNLFNSNTGILACFKNANKEYINTRILLDKEEREKAEEEARLKYEEQIKKIEEERKKLEEELRKQDTEQGITHEPLTSIDEIDSNYPPKALTKNISVNYFKGSKGFSYWMYVPDNVTTNLPVIMFLPGKGTPQGNDYTMTKVTANSAGLAYGPIRDVIDSNYSYNAIVLHLQVPSNNSVYEYISSYVQLIDRISETYKINKKKISVIGLSHGCYGVIHFVNKYPNYLSAAVPMGCNPMGIDIKLENFVSTPIWAFSGSGDGSGSKQMPEFEKQVNALGGNVKYTYAEGHPHNLLYKINQYDGYSVLRDTQYNIINWMISQYRK